MCLEQPLLIYLPHKFRAKMPGLSGSFIRGIYDFVFAFVEVKNVLQFHLLVISWAQTVILFRPIHLQANSSLKLCSKVKRSDKEVFAFACRLNQFRIKFCELI